MSHKHFSIEAFQVNKNNIIATILKEDYQDIKITRNKFEAWVDRTGRLAIDLGIYTDEELLIDFPVIQTRTFQEYYGSHDEVNFDLYEYILLTQGEKVFSEALVSNHSICSEYSHWKS